MLTELSQVNNTFYDVSVTQFFFVLQVAPYSSVIVNGIYWGPNMPRLITIPDAKHLLRKQESPWLPISEVRISKGTWKDIINRYLQNRYHAL